MPVFSDWEKMAPLPISPLVGEKLSLFFFLTFYMYIYIYLNSPQTIFKYNCLLTVYLVQTYILVAILVPLAE